MSKKIKRNNFYNYCDTLCHKAGFYKNKTAGILKNNSGLTLVELIIALAISVIVVAAAGFIHNVTGFLVSGVKTVGFTVYV